jgi:serine/threonine protein phosphatase PrpC
MISSHQNTNTGLRRTSNEDFFGSIATKFGAFYLVCDGMGGHSSGETASQLATESILQFVKNAKTDNTKELLKEAIQYANTIVFNAASKNTALKGMGTTLVLVLIKNNELFFAHVGDSRIYLSRRGNLEQLTEDHSFVQQLLKAGIISELEAKTHPRRNEITKAIGLKEIIEPTICASPLKIKKGDKILLCSDGLTNMVSKEKIFEIISKETSTEAKTTELIENANNAGGFDNITATLIEVEKVRRFNYKSLIGIALILITVLVGIFAFLKMNSTESSKKHLTDDKNIETIGHSKRIEIVSKPIEKVKKAIKKKQLKSISYDLSCMSDGKDGGSVSIINLLSETRDNVASNTIDKISVQEEMEFGAKAFEELKEKNTIRTNSKLNTILKRLSANLFNSKYVYRIYEIEDASLNAFTMGAYIYIHTGMLNFVKSDDELAAIIAHEINHNELGHINKKLSIKKTNDELFGELFSNIALNIDGILGASFNQKDETLCDLYGIDLIILAGYQPCSSVELWKRMSEEENDFNGVENLMRSHPYSSKRANCSANHLMGNYEVVCD